MHEMAWSWSWQWARLTFPKLGMLETSSSSTFMGEPIDPLPMSCLNWIGTVAQRLFACLSCPKPYGVCILFNPTAVTLSSHSRIEDIGGHEVDHPSRV